MLFDQTGKKGSGGGGGVRRRLRGDSFFNLCVAKIYKGSREAFLFSLFTVDFFMLRWMGWRVKHSSAVTCLRQLLPASCVHWGRGGYGGRAVQKQSHLHQRHVDRFGEETKAGYSCYFL